MNVMQLIQRLERIAAEYGSETRVECRNVAGDLDHLDAVSLSVSKRGVSVVILDTWDHYEFNSMNGEKKSG